MKSNMSRQKSGSRLRLWRTSGKTKISKIMLWSIAFALVFKVLPDIEIAWRDVWTGAVVTDLLVTVGGLLITFYLKSSSIGSALEFAGSYAVVLLGIYYVALIFLIGAIFTRVYAHMFGSWRESTVEGE